jgi:hypothetical protein
MDASFYRTDIVHLLQLQENYDYLFNYVHCCIGRLLLSVLAATAAAAAAVETAAAAAAAAATATSSFALELVIRRLFSICICIKVKHMLACTSSAACSCLS